MPSSQQSCACGPKTTGPTVRDVRATQTFCVQGRTIVDKVCHRKARCACPSLVSRRVVCVDNDKHLFADGAQARALLDLLEPEVQDALRPRNLEQRLRH